jgi:hypothetical protein
VDDLQAALEGLIGHVEQCDASVERKVSIEIQEAARDAVGRAKSWAR